VEQRRGIEGGGRDEELRAEELKEEGAGREKRN
jgi:hypothetical protein